jgi:hypothetical protein
MNDKDFSNFVQKLAERASDYAKFNEIITNINDGGESNE